VAREFWEQISCYVHFTFSRKHTLDARTFRKIGIPWYSHALSNLHQIDDDWWPHGAISYELLAGDILRTPGLEPADRLYSWTIERCDRLCNLGFQRIRAVELQSLILGGLWSQPKPLTKCFRIEHIWKCHLFHIEMFHFEANPYWRGWDYMFTCLSSHSLVSSSIWLVNSARRAWLSPHRMSYYDTSIVYNMNI